MRRDTIKILIAYIKNDNDKNNDKWILYYRIRIPSFTPLDIVQHNYLIKHNHII